uniref:Uncharacterized protein n=1 Tax=Amphimedon queenslandica TaxID=400682 RepID=A0A1X7TKI4_AMPQE
TSYKNNKRIKHIKHCPLLTRSASVNEYMSVSTYTSTINRS